MRRGTCWICYEDIEWDIEKFCWNNRGTSAAPTAAPAVPAQSESAVEDNRELIEREEPEDDDSKSSGSSSDEDSEEEQSNNSQSTNWRFPSISPLLLPSSSNFRALGFTVDEVYVSHNRPRTHRPSAIKALELIRKDAELRASSQSNESVPLPGNPALIWQETQETREQQQQQGNEGHQAALPNLSPASDHIISALNPDGGNMEPSELAPAPNTARVPVRDPTSRSSSLAAETSACTATTATPQYDQAGATSITARDTPVEGSMSQPPQVSATTAIHITTEPAGATGTQRTTSDIDTDNPASASVPVPTDHSTSAPTLAHSGTKITIGHTKALDLVQECSRLAKKSTQIRKKSEREAKRMEKKHRRELKKTKRKVKHEVKRLEKKIKRLEKEVLKALAGPEVV